ncbi:MAG TPA: molecular chaperone [Croceibacterium sp.]|nr:molecular chaperone [Croceibacterium sp.]
MRFADVTSWRLGGAALAAMIACATPTPLAAQGDLLIAPTRLVLDGRRGGEVILYNIGSEEATYRVTLELRRMTPEGELEPVAESAANALEKASLEMIRYAPRRVTLPPSEPQAIRISARPGAELPDGEYRVHMSFAAVPKVKPLEPPSATPETGLVINLTPIYGITMPIIIRKGQLEVTAAIANARLEENEQGPAFTVDIARSGEASVYGDLLVYRQGQDEPAFVARGIGVYPEIDRRHSTFGLSPEQAAAMRGPVRVELRQPLQDGGALITALDAVLG